MARRDRVDQSIGYPTRGLGLTGCLAPPRHYPTIDTKTGSPPGTRTRTHAPAARWLSPPAPAPAPAPPPPPGMHWKGGGYPRPPSRAPTLCPATVPLTPSASLKGIRSRQ